MVGLRLDGFKKALSSEDRALLTGWFKGDLTPDHSDPFPKMCIRPFGKNCEALGPFAGQAGVDVPGLCKWKVPLLFLK